MENSVMERDHTTAPQAATNLGSGLSFSTIISTNQAPIPSTFQVVVLNSPNNTGVGIVVWFRDVPAEIRCMIYQLLIGRVIVNVNASAFPVAYISPARPDPTIPFGPTIGPPTNNSSWLAVSRQFFQEARNEIWKIALVKFERRWDFMNAFANQSLNANPPSNVAFGHNTIIMNPIGTDVFQKIHRLHINLTNASDFEGTVTVQEAKRVTKTILTIIKSSMPSVRKLKLSIDDRSRIAEPTTGVLPHPWFLEALLALTKVKDIKLVVGGGLVGIGSNRAVAQACIWAFNEVMREHLQTSNERERLGWGVSSPRRLQAKVGRKMLLLLYVREPSKHVVWNRLRMKCQILELHP